MLIFSKEHDMKTHIAGLAKNILVVDLARSTLRPGTLQSGLVDQKGGMSVVTFRIALQKKKKKTLQFCKGI